jgi:hypothetical protein
LLHIPDSPEQVVSNTIPQKPVSVVNVIFTQLGFGSLFKALVLRVLLCSTDTVFYAPTSSDLESYFGCFFYRAMGDQLRWVRGISSKLNASRPELQHHAVPGHDYL